MLPLPPSPVRAAQVWGHLPSSTLATGPVPVRVLRPRKAPPWGRRGLPSAVAATASFLCLEQRPVHSECPVHVRRVSDMRSAQRWPREGFGGPFGGVSLRRGRAPTQPEGRGCTGVLPARVRPGGTGSEGPAEALALSPGRRPALSHTRGSGSAAAGSPT